MNGRLLVLEYHGSRLPDGRVRTGAGRAAPNNTQLICSGRQSVLGPAAGATEEWKEEEGQLTPRGYKGASRYDQVQAGYGYAERRRQRPIPTFLQLMAHP